MRRRDNFPGADTGGQLLLDSSIPMRNPDDAEPVNRGLPYSEASSAVTSTVVDQSVPSGC